MNRTGIEWTDYTWNPMVGCTERCGSTPEYPEGWCYARRMAKRFKPGVRADGTAYGCQRCYDFIPHLHPERLDQPRKVRGSRIVFCGSMGDLFDPQVEPEWRRQVWAAMNAAWWHHYVMLTKRPDLVEPEELLELYAGPMNGDLICGGFWLGVSITCDDDWWRVERLVEIKRAEWGIGAVVSAEPLLGPITHEIPGEISWVIVGAQTGAGAVAPERDWAFGLRATVLHQHVPLFEKDNLQPDTFLSPVQHWPEAMVAETTGRARGDGGGAT